MTTLIFDERNNLDWVENVIPPIIAFILLVIIGLYLHKKRNSYGKVILVLCIPLGLITFTFGAFEFQHIACIYWLNSGNYDTIEDVISNHDIHDYARVREEEFYVRNVYFIVHGRQKSRCGPNISGTFGSVAFRDGMQVKIYYKPIDYFSIDSPSKQKTENVILRIELLSYGD
jgi:hypothetical protein